MNQSDHRAQTEAKLKADPDVKAHHDRRGYHRPGAALTQLGAYLGSHRFDPADFKLAGTELLGQFRFHFFTEFTELNRRSLQSHEKFVRAFLAEILNRRITRAHLAQCPPDLVNGHAAGEFQLGHRAARKVDAEERPFKKK